MKGRRQWFKNAGSIAVIAFALGLGAYVWWVEKDHVSDVERASRPKNVFPAFRRNELSRVEISTDQDKLVFERQSADDAGDHDWRMTSPRDEKVEPDALDRLLGALEFASFVRKVDDGQGMQPARAHGSVTMGKLVLAFTVGQVAPAPEGASYFSVAGEGTFVVGKDVVTELLKGSNAYRSKSIVPYLSIDLSRLEIAGPAEKWAIERKDDVAFVFDDTKLRASREKLDRVWLAFADMRADSFLESFDDTHPAFTIRMVHKDATRPPAELAVLGPCPGTPNDVVVVRRAPSRVIACVPKVVLDGLGTPRAQIIDDRLFVARPDEVEEITLETVPPAVRVELARKGSGWHERSPVDRDLAGDEVDVTNALVSAIARGVGADAAIDKGCAVRSRVTLVRTETHVAETVDVGVCEDKRVSVVRGLDGGRLFVANDLARKLAPRAGALLGRELIATPIDVKDVSSMSLRCGVDQDLSRTSASWSLDAPKGFPVDQAGAVDLLDTLVHARADAWVSDEDDPAFGIAASRCSIKLVVGGREVTVAVGKEGEGGVYGRVQDARAAAPSPVFVAPRALATALGKILIDRSVLLVDHPESVRLTAGARAVELTRHGASDLAFADGGAAFDVDRTLGGLRADQVVHLGAPLANEGFASPSLSIEARVTLDGGARTRKITLGRATVRDNQNMYFARVDGIDATYAVSQDRVVALFDLVR